MRCDHRDADGVRCHATNAQVTKYVSGRYCDEHSPITPRGAVMREREIRERVARLLFETDLDEVDLVAQTWDECCAYGWAQPYRNTADRILALISAPDDAIADAQTQTAPDGARCVACDQPITDDEPWRLIDDDTYLHLVCDVFGDEHADDAIADAQTQTARVVFEMDGAGRYRIRVGDEVGHDVMYSGVAMLVTEDGTAYAAFSNYWGDSALPGFTPEVVYRLTKLETDPEYDMSKRFTDEWVG